MAFDDVWRQMAADPSIDLLPPVGQPQLPDGLALPQDVEAFYARCGGATLFPRSFYPITIVEPAAIL